MAQRDHALSIYDMEKQHQTVYFFVKLLAGAVLFGSAIAYTILAKQDVGQASTPLTLFFVSLVVFGAANVSLILMYGKYTVTLGIACLMLVIATGRTIEADLLPFFAMLAAFLTLAWPYLGESLYRFRRHWYTPLSVDDLESGPLPSGYVPLGHIYVDSLEEDHRNGHGPWASRQAGPRDQSQGLPQAGLVGTDTTNSPRASIIASFSINARNQSHSPSGRSELLLHIGGAATGSGRSTPPSEQSISLSAVTGRVPSDISSNVLQLLVGHTGQDEGGTNESKTVSQRRADILDLPLKRSGQPQEGDAQSSLLANAGAFDEPQASKRPPQVSDEPQASKRPKVSSELQASDEHQAPETPPASNAPP